MPDLATSLTVIFLERVAGLLGLCIVAAVAFVMSDDIRDDFVAKVLELGLLGALGLSAFVLVAPWQIAQRPTLRALVKKLPIAGPIVLRIPVARSGWGIAVSVFHSVIMQALVVLSVALLVQPLAPAVTLVVCARVVPAIILTTYIPLTPGGLGQRELVFKYMFGLVGVAPDAAVATSLLFFALLMGLSALGGLCLLAERALGLDVPLLALIGRSQDLRCGQPRTVTKAQTGDTATVGLGSTRKTVLVTGAGRVFGHTWSIGSWPKASRWWASTT